MGQDDIFFTSLEFCVRLGQISQGSHLIYMHDETITFQLATHYLPKVALRLECLFLTIDQACEETQALLRICR